MTEEEKGDKGGKYKEGLARIMGRLEEKVDRREELVEIVCYKKNVGNFIKESKEVEQKERKLI